MPPAQDDGTPKTLAGSTGKFTLTEIRNGFGPADWHPGDHPAMPEIVARGKKDANVRACSLCHYPNGKGRAENAPVSGLPVSYFIQQMQDYRADKRKSADPKKANTNAMIAIAKGMTDEEIKASAEYFGSMKWTPWIKVVESRTVPKTRIAGGLFISLPGNETEPLGQRIIEMPEDNAREALRDPRSGFVAYVPVGSIKKGEALVKTGGGRTTACAVCHGTDLKGLGPVPGTRRPFAELRRQTVVRHADWRAEWFVGGLDEARRGEADGRGLDQYFSLHREPRTLVIGAVSGTTKWKLCRFRALAQSRAGRLSRASSRRARSLHPRTISFAVHLRSSARAVLAPSIG